MSARIRQLYCRFALDREVDAGAAAKRPSKLIERREPRIRLKRRVDFIDEPERVARPIVGAVVLAPSLRRRSIEGNRVRQTGTRATPSASCKPDTRRYEYGIGDGSTT